MAARRARIDDLFWPRGSWRVVLDVVELVIKLGDAESCESGSVTAEVGVGLCCGLGCAGSKMWRWEGCKTV
jgi:hypothetical protein